MTTNQLSETHEDHKELNAPKKSRKMTFEDILKDIGDYGKYQRRLTYTFLIPVSALTPIFMMNSLFMVSVPDHWCNVTELDQWNLTLEQQHLLIRPPNDPRCSRYELNYTNLFDSPGWNWTIPDNTTMSRCLEGYRFDQSDYDKTASTVWNLVCKDSHYNSLILTLLELGSFIGTPVYGYLSDKAGRKPTILVLAAVAFVSGIASVLVRNFSAFAILRTFSGSVLPALFQVPIVILMEIVGPTTRTKLNSLSNVAWTAGSCILPLIAWLCRDWVLFGLVTSSLPFLFVLYWKFLHESPRWLLSQGRYEEAAHLMYNIAKTNEQCCSREELSSRLKELGGEAEKNKIIIGGKKVSAADFIRYPTLRKHFLIVTSLWVACNVSYYGLQYNVPNLDGNEFLNFFYLSVVEFPAAFFCRYCMEKWGRRWVSVTTFTLTGIVLLVPTFSEKGGVAASIIGKYGAYSAYMLTYQLALELYPTPLRTIGMGLSGTVSVVAGIIVPYVIYLSEYGRFIPFLVFACVCITAGCAASFLPETLNEVLPQTVADAERFGKDQKFFSCSKRERRPSCDNKVIVPLHGDSNNGELESEKIEL